MLDSTNPACAAVASLVVFHGLRSAELRDLKLIDVRDGRLHLSDRTIPLAAPARERLNLWLGHRQDRWPATVNPHLFIHHRNAGGVGPVGVLWVGRTLGIAPSVVRADRILDEAITSRGDVRRLSDLFGMSIQAAIRYAAVIDHPGLHHADTEMGESGDASGRRDVGL